MTRRGGLPAAFDRATRRARRLWARLAAPARHQTALTPKPRLASALFHGHEFDSFLFAQIGEEKNGMLLSVLSALARQDIDPWREAARLARLPSAIATESLCATIAALPAGAADRADPRSIAERLIALLPLGGDSGRSPQARPAGAALATKADTLKYIIAMVLVLGLLSFAQNLRQPAPTEGARAPVARIAVPPANPPANPSANPPALGH